MVDAEVQLAVGASALPGRSLKRLVPRSELADASREPAVPDHPIRARGVGEILDVALDVFLRRFWFCAGGSAFLWLLANGFGARRAGAEPTPFAGIEATLLVHYLTTAFVVVAVYGELQGRRVAGSRALLLALKRFPALLVLALWAVIGFSALNQLMRSCTIVVLPLVLIGAIIVLWLLALAPAAVVLEDIGPVRAARRSATLAAGAFLPWIVLVLLQAWLVAPLTGPAGALDTPEGRELLSDLLPFPTALRQGVWLVVQSLIEGITTAFGAVAMAVFYVDRRVRKEGFDLTMRLERVEAVAREEAA